MQKSPLRISTAVILAAGMGSRLFNGEEKPKPLLKVAGLPIIARVMKTAAKAGIRRFVIVVGYQAETMRAEIPSLLPAGCTIELLENHRFEESNGVSLLEALKVVQEPFALLMSDHIFSHDRLDLAMDRYAETGRCLLVVEDKKHFDGDIEDATKICVEYGSVRDIDKGLQTYDAIDTGMFVLRPESARSAFDRCGSSPSISCGMRMLASLDGLDAFYVNQGYWQDIDTPEDLTRAETKLTGSLTRPPDAFFTRLRTTFGKGMNFEKI